MLKTYPSADDSCAATPNTQIAAAFQAGLMLAELFRSFPLHDAAEFALLRDAAVHATATASKAAPYWIGTVPDWAPHAGAAAAGIAWLGRRLSCLAAAASGTTWDDENFEQAIARNFSVSSRRREISCMFRMAYWKQTCAARRARPSSVRGTRYR